MHNQRIPNLKLKHWCAFWQIFAPLTAPVLGFAIASGAEAATPGLVNIARANQFLACAAELERLDRNLFAKAETAIRPFAAEKNASAKPFSAVIDARKTLPNGSATRTLTHLTVTPSGKNEACAISYEQTQYHDERCDAVQTQLAPQAKPAALTSLGAVTLDLHRNMTLTLIPVGAAQCVTVLKEVSY